MSALSDLTSESTALTSAVSDDALAASTAAGTLAGDEVADLAASTAASATPGTATADDPVQLAIAGIPENDDDLATITDEQQRTALSAVRGQLRTITGAYRELEPLRAFRDYGEPSAVKTRLDLASLLYSPVLDANQQPKRDPATGALLRTTRPFVQRLDYSSPGMVEQLLVDILDYRPLAEDGKNHVSYRMIDSLFHLYGLNFGRLADYKNIDALIAKTTGNITPEELAEIPADRHAAYRTIPPSIRAAWKSYDDADRTRMLDDYQGKLDATAREATQVERDKAAKAAADEAYANEVFEAQIAYFATVRKERTAALINSLSKQVIFSADPITNRVMIGSLAAGLAQLLDRDWRFVYIDEVLTPLGLKLDHTFDAALDKYETNAMEAVAQKKAGDRGQAAQAHEDATSATNQLMAKIAIFALKVARAMGATVVEAATLQGNALAAAGTGTLQAGNASVAGIDPNLPPAGIRPGSPEWARFYADRFPRQQ